ncbi:RNA polymerase factor sigma-54 [Bacillus luteolus]|uniref:RNA polymerase factor sigma-54 n=1 Tax=Litchfieldia luteola TaxID=682179 RepID=A0ABR9QEQ7_9BACI|nr:RNA polymerase factor sigma-54 [Cytobacillus luteolus]MBE4906981.1 RNA polymerase factor sigma-54 [Cytobacillus luteolus]MBP1943552.1 RNA polymerase sigma-54 factor [Cytobacillus luteolus]
MNMRVGLFQQQSLKLTMTKELTQAITLLQYSSLELSEFLQEQTLENPLIEISGAEANLYSKKKAPLKRAERMNPLDFVDLHQKTLHQHLSEQVSLIKLEPYQRKIAEYIIDLLDHNGYLTMDSDEIAANLSITEELVENTLNLIKNLDPAGVGARSVKESLLLQLKRLPNRHRSAEDIISNHFDLFASKSWRELSKQTSYDLKTIQEVSDLIVTLNPRPGNAFYDGKQDYITPDLSVTVENGNIEINLHDELLPKVSLNLQYYNSLETVNDAQARSYLKEKAQQCQWIIKSLEQRKQTILHVMNEIIQRQPDYFLKGTTYLRPLTMKEVADAIDVHESTVSRTCRDKYVQTPYGVVEMKSFFSSAIQTANSGEETSSAGVKEMIEKIVSEEDKKKPLSDQKIVEILKDEHNIVVSRRTIAKYRDQLGILSSSQRKRYD